ncbi:MAG: glutathione S-transferase [Wenzhouxiangellaceae bacterium]
MITVHHLNNSRSQRILWLLEELQLEYQIKHYQRDPETMLAPDALREVHPLGKSPVLTEDDLTIAESGAIIDYLIERHGQGRLTPASGGSDWLLYRYWMHYAEGSAMPPLLLKLIFDRLSQPPMPLLMRPLAGAIAAGVKAKFITPQIERHLAFQEQHLQQHRWFAGDEFSAADIQMSFPVEASYSRDVLNEDEHPALLEYLQRIHDREAYQKALERGGPYELID